jgi:hypothetical protein
MKKCLLALLLVAAIALPAQAGSLSIGGQDLGWSGTGTSPTFTIGIENPAPAVTDQLAGWQLGLTIVAQGGAAGSLSFATVALPANYLLNGNSEYQSGMGFIPGYPTLPATSIAAIGDVTVSGGVMVPGSGDNLLALTFSATAGTNGVFDIYATAPTSSYATGSYWIDSSFNFQNFGGLSTGSGGELLLGQVSITPSTVIPEPQSFVLLLCGLAGAVVYCRGHRARAR